MPKKKQPAEQADGAASAANEMLPSGYELLPKGSTVRQHDIQLYSNGWQPVTTGVGKTVGEYWSYMQNRPFLVARKK